LSISSCAYFLISFRSNSALSAIYLNTSISDCNSLILLLNWLISVSDALDTWFSCLSTFTYTSKAAISASFCLIELIFSACKLSCPRYSWLSMALCSAASASLSYSCCSSHIASCFAFSASPCISLYCVTCTYSPFMVLRWFFASSSNSATLSLSYWFSKASISERSLCSSHFNL
jgi:hypothetical protein